MPTRTILVVLTVCVPASSCDDGWALLEPLNCMVNQGIQIRTPKVVPL